MQQDMGYYKNWTIIVINNKITSWRKILRFCEVL